jgi:hypothetical protein
LSARGKSTPELLLELYSKIGKGLHYQPGFVISCETRQTNEQNTLMGQLLMKDEFSEILVGGD